MTFAPRSCPSSPGLAMTTRIFWLMSVSVLSPRSSVHRHCLLLTAYRLLRTASDYRILDVLAPDFPQTVTHLTNGGMGLHRLDQQRHQIRFALRAALQALDGGVHTRSIAPAAGVVEAG